MVLLLVVEVVCKYAPRQHAQGIAEPVASATALYGGVRATLHASGVQDMEAETEAP